MGNVLKVMLKNSYIISLKPTIWLMNTSSVSGRTVDGVILYSILCDLMHQMRAAYGFREIIVPISNVRNKFGGCAALK